MFLILQHVTLRPSYNSFYFPFICIFGSKTSRSQSPNKIIPCAVIVTAITGNVATPQLSAKSSLPVFNIIPQDTVGGCTPIPKKLKEASAIIVLATLKVAVTISEDDIFGNKCRKIIVKSFTPMDW